MIASTAWRFVWKEYRHLRAFWVVLVVIAILIQLPLALAAALKNPAFSSEAPNSLAFLITCFYAFGCGAMLFAHEHDESTFELLRGMPIPWQGMLLGKSAVAAASTLLLIVFLALTSKGTTLFAMYVHDSQIADSAGLSPVVIIGYGLIIPEALLWGAFWSLVSRRTLYAVVLAAASWLLCMLVFTWHSARTIDMGEAALPARIAIVVGLALLITAIASKWLEERLRLWKRPARAAATRETQRYEFVSLRLTWCFWRMSRNFWFGLAAIVVMAPPLLKLANLPTRPLTESSWTAALATFSMSLSLAIVCVPVLAGLATFHFDWHKQRYRFLSHLGVDPHRFWLSRQLSVTLLFAALAFLAVISLALSGVGESVFDGLPPSMSNSLLIFPLIAFVTGQFIGLFCRSPIIAVFVAMTIACAAQVWLILAGHLVESTWVWLALTCSIFPAMTLATWLRTPSWLLGSSRNRDWLLPLLIPVVILAGQLVCFVAYRVFEVPNVAVAADWDRYAAKVTPAALATAKQYDALAAQLVADPKNKALLDDILRVTSRPACALHDFRDPSIRGRVYDDGFYDGGFDHSTTDIMARPITDYLLRRANGYKQSGELSQAWRCYEGALNVANHLYQLGLQGELLHGFQVEQRVQRELVQWALLPNQEADLLRASADRLRRLGDEQPSLKQNVELHFLLAQGLMSRSQDAKWMPWEGVRAARLNRALTAKYLRSVDEMEDRLARRIAMKVAASHAWGYFADEKELASLNSRTLTGLDYYSYSINTAYFWNELLRRGTICALAVARYRVEYGSLPTNIEQLNDLPGYETVFDPTTGQTFEYRPTGMPVETRMWSQNNDAIDNAPGTPLLWSEGRDVTITTHAAHKREWYGVGIPIGVAGTSDTSR